MHDKSPPPQGFNAFAAPNPVLPPQIPMNPVMLHQMQQQLAMLQAAQGGSLEQMHEVTPKSHQKKVHRSRKRFKKKQKYYAATSDSEGSGSNSESEEPSSDSSNEEDAPMSRKRHRKHTKRKKKESRKRCYNCQSRDHLAEFCPLLGKKEVGSLLSLLCLLLLCFFCFLFSCTGVLEKGECASSGDGETEFALSSPHVCSKCATL